MAQMKYFCSICVRLKFIALNYVCCKLKLIENPASMKMYVYISMCVNNSASGTMDI
jgi:hypothetical protein